MSRTSSPYLEAWSDANSHFGVLYCNKSRPENLVWSRVMPLQKKVGAKHKRTLAHIEFGLGRRQWPSQALTVTVRSLGKGGKAKSYVPDFGDCHHSRGRVVWCLTPDILTVCKYGLLLYCLSKHHSTGPADDRKTFMKGWFHRSTLRTILRCEAR